MVGILPGKMILQFSCVSSDLRWNTQNNHAETNTYPSHFRSFPPRNALALLQLRTFTGTGMIRDLIKWVAPGLATVLGGTTLCLAMTSTDIANDLASRSAAAMAAGGYDWAELSLDARDLTLSGTTTDQSLLDAAIARLAALDGVRSVRTDVALAPIARPYSLRATIDQGAITLAGGVPNETARQRLLSLAGLEEGALELRSGARFTLPVECQR